MDRKDNPITNLLNRLGPGLITGASDDDPSGIGTYTQAGAALGFATLWTAIVTLPLMIVVQHICAKIGMVVTRNRRNGFTRRRGDAERDASLLSAFICVICG